MDASELSKDYWKNSNVITGFAAIQAIAFFYAASSDKAPQFLKHTSGKVTFFVLAFVGYCLYAYGAWWCGREAIRMAELATKTETTWSPALKNSMEIANRGRVISIFFFLIAGVYALICGVH